MTTEELVEKWAVNKDSNIKDAIMLEPFEMCDSKEGEWFLYGGNIRSNLWPKF